ncbi:keratin-like protein KRT222 isoform X1 [Stegostoma tigrinum]|uniref:keratin-like protein KRT222 isoform X1 n=1 Tax=Stegostoma tigrinum TaxID=3053191 RepID=UPI00202B9F1C|nr:keratin-like protein KRT222 isoform X1 [Stegostoma tigrinum]XP_048416359.1 keratin-like protein KRT222 isoform X1 [Stegostoma tigrinum]XP_059494614.1 keratin-like protein KRT222 isoform X1 [Stegostoma tigrinum]
MEDGGRRELGLSQLLTDIKKHYEKIIHRNWMELDACINTQLLEVSDAEMNKNEDSLQAAQAELNNARRQWHSLQVEIESLHALQKGLENSLQVTEQRYEVQLKNLASVIRELEGELHGVRRDIEHQVWEHELLLNTKMKLESEIAMYRSLLDREDDRLSGATSSDYQSSLSSLSQKEMALPSAATISSRLEQRIQMVTTQEILGQNSMAGSSKAHGKIQTEKVDEVIKEWECSFFKDNPHLRKKSTSLRFDLHLAATDESCSQTKQGSLPDIELRLVMRKSSSIPSLKS